MQLLVKHSLLYTKKALIQGFSNSDSVLLGSIYPTKQKTGLNNIIHDRVFNEIGIVLEMHFFHDP